MQTFLGIYVCSLSRNHQNIEQVLYYAKTVWIINILFGERTGEEQ